MKTCQKNKQEKSKMPILFTKDGSPPSPIPGGDYKTNIFGY